jgi:tRNA pseudouridine55 synthase
MTVTSGFYVRSLCHDLGEKLGCGGMMAELSRTRQGQFVLGGANCMEYEELLKGEDVWGPKIRSMLELWNNPDAKQPEQPKEQPESGEEARAPEQADESPKPAEEVNATKKVEEGEKPAEDAEATSEAK